MEKKSIKQEALHFHAQGKPGKLEISPTKPLTTQWDLSLAYSPGVAHPCTEIEKNPLLSYEYTNRANMVAVISNGTAVLGLGNIGALASKPVMEGKCVLFKKFADVDAIDLELATEDIDSFIDAVSLMGPSFGGINLEDIKAPECFIIEQQLKQKMDIPVFHDDQHGTAIVAAAGLINAAHIVGKNFAHMKLVVNGAGAASISCVELVKSMGIKDENVILCDSKGVIYQGRKAGMNQWKSKHAVKTDDRTLSDAIKGADAFFGLSIKDALNKDMIASMAKDPIIFAMANPDPETTPDEVAKIRNDAIVATGRSDYVNQVNNVLGFPFIFRGALDVQATKINEEMKIAAAHAIAELARLPVPAEILQSYGYEQINFGKQYIIPMPFDYRLISVVSPAVAKAAMDTGVAQKPIQNMDAYVQSLKNRLDPTANAMQAIFNRLKQQPKRVVFAEGENEHTIMAASAYQEAGYGDAILIGNVGYVQNKLKEMNIATDLTIVDAASTPDIDNMIDNMYQSMWRKGLLKRDISRLMKTDRNVFSVAYMRAGKADAMITASSRTYTSNLDMVAEFIPPAPNKTPIGIMMIISKGRTVFLADASIHKRPTAEQLAEIAKSAALFAHRMGHTPRVAFVSFSSFGSRPGRTHDCIQQARYILNIEQVSFEHDGEMLAHLALNYDVLQQYYPQTNLSTSANILVVPDLTTASVASRILQELGGGHVMGPLLTGYEIPVQIPQITTSANDLINLAVLSAYDSI